MVITLILLSLLQHCWSMELKSCSNAKHDEICTVVANYDKSKIPGNLPLTLSPKFDINEIVEVNGVEGFITILMWLEVGWEDRHLSYKPKQMWVN